MNATPCFQLQELPLQAVDMRTHIQRIGNWVPISLTDALCGQISQFFQDHPQGVYPLVIQQENTYSITQSQEIIDEKKCFSNEIQERTYYCIQLLSSDGQQLAEAKNPDRVEAIRAVFTSIHCAFVALRAF